MCYSSERFRPVFSIIYFIYDSINCPTTRGEGGGGGGWFTDIYNYVIAMRKEDH